jgi:hypothetical protein
MAQVGASETTAWVTLFLAVWGAIISTAAMAWNLARDLGNRGKLHVMCYPGKVYGSPNPLDKGVKLVYRVTNVGRQPIVVTTIGGAIAKDRHFLIQFRGECPRTLQPGDYLLEYSSDLSVLDDRPIALWAIDSTGKHWKVPKKNLRWLLEQHEERGKGRPTSHS